MKKNSGKENDAQQDWNEMKKFCNEPVIEHEWDAKEGKNQIIIESPGDGCIVVGVGLQESRHSYHVILHIIPITQSCLEKRENGNEGNN
jgi:hypothetical protein